MALKIKEVHPSVVGQSGNRNAFAIYDGSSLVYKTTRGGGRGAPMYGLSRTKADFLLAKEQARRAGGGKAPKATRASASTSRPARQKLDRQELTVTGCTNFLRAEGYSVSKKKGSSRKKKTLDEMLEDGDISFMEAVAMGYEANPRRRRKNPRRRAEKKKSRSNPSVDARIRRMMRKQTIPTKDEMYVVFAFDEGMTPIFYPVKKGQDATNALPPTYESVYIDMIGEGYSDYRSYPMSVSQAYDELMEAEETRLAEALMDFQTLDDQVMPNMRAAKGKIAQALRSFDHLQMYGSPYERNPRKNPLPKGPYQYDPDGAYMEGYFDQEGGPDFGHYNFYTVRGRKTKATDGIEATVTKVRSGWKVKITHQFMLPEDPSNTYTQVLRQKPTPHDIQQIIDRVVASTTKNVPGYGRIIQIRVSPDARRKRKNPRRNGGHRVPVRGRKDLNRRGLDSSEYAYARPTAKEAEAFLRKRGLTDIQKVGTNTISETLFGNSRPEMRNPPAQIPVWTFLAYDGDEDTTGEYHVFLEQVAPYKGRGKMEPPHITFLMEFDALEQFNPRRRRKNPRAMRRLR